MSVGNAHDSADALLALMWLASPALPVGGFSYSEGLEAAVEARLVASEADTARWLADQLDLALARADLPLMLRALDAWRSFDVDRAERLNAWVRRTREAAESRRQSEQMGRSLVEWLRNGGTRSGTRSAAAAPLLDARIEALAAFAPAPTWQVAFGLAAALTGAAPRAAALAYAFGWAENMVQAAMKTVPLGQGAAQRVLGQLAAALPALVDAARALVGIEPGIGVDADVWPFAAANPDAPSGAADGHGPQAYAPMWAILSSQHESQYSRLFRS